MKIYVLCASTMLGLSTAAYADITTVNKTGKDLPKLLMYQGRGACEKMANKIKDEMVSKTYSYKWANTGTNMDSICWRRTKDFDKPADDPDNLTGWTQCISDGECQIN